MSNIYSNRLKIYPNGTSEYVIFKKGLTVTNGAKVQKTGKPTKKMQLKMEDIPYYPQRIDDYTELQKLARRKAKVRDLVLSGNFDFFGTMTLNPEHASQDLEAVLRKKMTLYTRMLRRRGVRYYIVAEKHKSGVIHFHALYSHNIPTAQSPASKRFLTIPLWHFGYSSISRIRDKVGTAYYVTKYVTKEALTGRSVWTSQGLMQPRVLYNTPDLLTPIVSEWENDNIIKVIRNI